MLREVARSPLKRVARSPLERAGNSPPPTPAAPAFLTAPTINGDPVVGVPTSYTSGTYSGYPSPVTTQQWTYNGADIGGATGSTYTPTAGQEAGLLRVRQILTNGSGNANSTSAPATINRIAAVTTAPAIVGTPQVGVATSYTPGTIVGFPAPSTTQQWTLDGVDVPGATGATYTPITGDVGKALRVRQIATNAYGSGNNTSASASVVSSGSAPNIGNAPVIIGTPEVGVASAYTPGNVTGSPTPTRTQLWFIDGVTTGVTTATYTPVLGDVGKTLTVAQIETNIHGSDNYVSAGVVVIAATSTIRPRPPQFTIDSVGGVGNAHLYWTLMDYLADGTTLANNLTKLSVRYGPNEGEQFQGGTGTSSPIDITPASLTDAIVTLPAGTHWIGITAANPSGESYTSNEIQLTVT